MYIIPVFTFTALHPSIIHNIIYVYILIKCVVLDTTWNEGSISKSDTDRTYSLHDMLMFKTDNVYNTDRSSGTNTIDLSNHQIVV